MSQKVNAVPDASFSVPPLTTTAGTRVSRRRIKVPCNYPGTNYGHNGQSALPSVVTFDIADNESFLDMDKSMIVLDFKPEFFSNSSQAVTHHPVSFDGSSQSLIARVRIGNSQGLIIEECQAYGTWANIMDSYSQSEDVTQHHLLDRSSALKNQLNPQKSFGNSEFSSVALKSHKYEKLYLRFKHSSFLKSCRMIPLFLMRNGIRFEIEFENVYKSLTRTISPSWQGPYFANIYNRTGVNSGSTVVTFSDFWFYDRNSSSLDLVIKPNSKLAQDLGLRQLLLSNMELILNANEAVPSGIVVNGYRNSNGWSIPLKFEYTDAFGTQHVLWQGLGNLEHLIRPYDSNGNLELNLGLNPAWANAGAQYFYLNTPAIDGGVDFDINLAQNTEFAFVVRLTMKYESGFDLLPSNRTGISGANKAFLPYSLSNLCVYADPTDMVSIPSSYAPSAIESSSHRHAGVTYAVTWSETNLASQPRYANYGIGTSNWNYSVKNVEMICDFVKPSSEVFLQFQQSFQAPAGIPYAYKRVLYHTRVLNPSEGLQQISLPISVRSLRGIVCVISDKLAWAPSSDGTSKTFNSLSAFMKRGLIRGQLVIGGQNYPSYDLNLSENGFEQIPELECLFNVAGLGSFNPNFDQKELQSTRNYMTGVGKTSTGATGFDGGWQEILPSFSENSSWGFQEYHDTSKFVLGLSTMKKDGDFVTGVDTSQAGSVSLNLYFKRSPDLANMFPGDSGNNRDIFVQVFCLADAVFTLQNDANLVRY